MATATDREATIWVTDREVELAEQYRNLKYGTDAIGLRHAVRDALQRAIEAEEK